VITSNIALFRKLQDIYSCYQSVLSSYFLLLGKNVRMVRYVPRYVPPPPAWYRYPGYRYRTTGTVPIRCTTYHRRARTAGARTAGARTHSCRTAVGQQATLALALAGARSHANNTHKELVKAYRAIMKVAVDLKKDGKNF
jgi:hypothetical protein